MVLIETHSQPEHEVIWQNEWGGKAYYAHGTSQARGLAIFTSKTISEKIANMFIDIEGRLIVFDLEEMGQWVTIAAVYAPNKDCPSFFSKLAELLRLRHENKIIIGDFNLTMDVDIDRKNTYCNNNLARDEILNLMDEFSLRETWRERNEQKREYSWIKKIVTGEERKASRIDFTLVSAGLDQKIKEILYLSSIMTDHRAIYAVVEMLDDDRGSGYWKMNTMLLQNKAFLDFMNSEITKCLDSTVEKNPLQRWEYIKSSIKKATGDFSRNKAQIDKIIIANLSEKVNEYESNLPLNVDEDRLYENTKQDLEEKVKERVAGVMFRSKAKWYELGEKSTKYFYSLEKSKYNAKTCFKLLDEQNNEIVGTQNILTAQHKFYSELYAKDEGVEFNITNTFDVKVTEEIKLQQDNCITVSDIHSAIMGMKNNKTPGKDGIPIDFYKVFWRQLKEAFTNMVNKAYEEKNLHSTAKEGILNLIPKTQQGY